VRLLAVFLIVLAGMALRLDAAWHGAPVNQPDSAAYERIARGLHEDGAFVQKGAGTPAHPQPATNYSPGLPLAVAGVFTLAGDDDTRLARILLALAGTLAIVFAWLLARRLAPPEDPGLAGLLAAAVVAFYPCLIADAGMLLTESLAGTLITGSSPSASNSSTASTTRSSTSATAPSRPTPTPARTRSSPPRTTGSPPAMPSSSPAPPSPTTTARSPSRQSTTTRSRSPSPTTAPRAPSVPGRPSPPACPRCATRRA